VKVGDFGLSRESSAAGDITDCDGNPDDFTVAQRDSFVLPSSSEAENTAGVGTQAYASPEQMRGSDYDASTDVFSLGLLLFELLYPMQTAMERYKEFACIRKGSFPTHWDSFVKTSFPNIHDLLVQMISDSAAERPTADVISDRIDSLLREYSVQSLDKSWGKKGALLLRVEAKEKEGILAHTMLLIRDAAPNSTVLQYGLRGQQSKAIMEFALKVEDNEKAKAVENIRSQLEDNGMSVRQVSNS
jgi:serine/threonine protein kinase